MFRKYLIVFLVSMVPLIELRGAIPYAIGFSLPLLPSYIIAIIGNTVLSTFLILCTEYIFYPVQGKNK